MVLLRIVKEKEESQKMQAVTRCKSYLKQTQTDKFLYTRADLFCKEMS